MSSSTRTKSQSTAGTAAVDTSPARTELPPSAESSVTVPAATGAHSCGEYRVGPARAGDHLAIHRLLIHLFQQPSSSEFQAQLEDPRYEPSDRILVRRGDQLVGHTLLLPREVRFGSINLPCGYIHDLGILPEYRSRGFATQLLAAAEQQLHADGALFGLLRTAVPGFFLKRGWLLGPRPAFSMAGAREILARLIEAPKPPVRFLEPDPIPLNIRIWRHVEQAALIRLYNQYASGRYGPAIRTDADWRWLLGRRAFDQVYVAIQGPDKLELDDTFAAIVGYAITRKSRILELITAPDCPAAATQLLARVCGDAIEQDLTYVRLDAPADDRLHAFFATAGGNPQVQPQGTGDCLMVKVFEPLTMLARLAPLFTQRVATARRTLPCELGLQCGSAKYSLNLQTTGLEIQVGRLGRSYLELQPNDLTALLFGQIELESALASGRIVASTRIAAETASMLFPAFNFHRQPWDLLTA